MQLNKANSQGWCVYDVKFKWSTTDIQLWLKTVTVAPSLMKEELGFFQSGPPSMLGTVRGNIVLATTSARVSHVLGPPAPNAHKCNKQQEGISPGSGALSPSNQIISHPYSWEFQQ